MTAPGRYLHAGGHGDVAGPYRHHLPVPQCAGRGNRGISNVTAPAVFGRLPL